MENPCAPPREQDENHSVQFDLLPNVKYPEDANPAEEIHWLLIFLSWSSLFIDTLGGTVIIPFITQLLDVSPLSQGFLFGISSAAATVLEPICGYIVDLGGWRSVLIWPFPIMIASNVMILFESHSYHLFLLSRFLQGTAMAILYPTVLTAVYSTHHRERRSSALGFVYTGDMGSIVGPVFGGLMYDRGGTVLVFGLLSFISALMFVLYVIYIPYLPEDVVDDDTDSASEFPARSPLIQPARSPLIAPLSRATSCSGLSRGQSCETHGLLGAAMSTDSKEGTLRGAVVPGTLNTPRLRKAGSLSAVSSSGRDDVSETGHAKRPSFRSFIEGYSNFVEFHFIVAMLAICYPWGSAVAIQALMPIVWYRQYHLTATTMGMFFSPYLLIRVLAGGFFPVISERFNLNLQRFIVCGLFILTTVLFALTMTNQLEVHAVLLGLAGLGLGMTDGCLVPFVGNYVKDRGMTDHGKAFALMGEAFDIGTLVSPVAAAMFARHDSENFGLMILGFAGIFVFAFSLISLFTYPGEKFLQRKTSPLTAPLLEQPEVSFV